MRLIPRTLTQIDSPIRATYALLEHRAGKRDLLDLSQAAPSYPPAPEVAEHIAATASDPLGGRYVDIAGLPKLRDAFAAELTDAYQGSVDPDDVIVTAGCNQAFCLAVSTLAAPGDEIVLPVPYYFNHDMWLRLEGITPVYIEPDVDAARASLTARTRAIVLVTPNNPTGVTLGPDTIADFASLAAEHDIALIIDETYRSFRGTDEPPHSLFADPSWRETVISLHSFSKDLAIPGYRVGALVAAPIFTREAMKLLDCVAICAPRIGQEAAWAGLVKATAWRRTKTEELKAKQLLFEAAMADQPGGFELISIGAYFAWIKHPYHHTDEVVRDLIVNHDTLVISGNAFLPDDRRMLRASFANLDAAAIADFASRLESRLESSQESLTPPGQRP